jgi:hypothetical protein
MKPRILTVVASLGLMGAFAAAPLALAGQPHEDSLSDGTHHGGMVDRTIAIDDKTKWINVTEGETVRFLVGGKSFAWIFDSYDQGKDLKQIAPKGMLGDRPVKVYVAADPRGRI